MTAQQLNYLILRLQDQDNPERPMVRRLRKVLKLQALDKKWNRVIIPCAFFVGAVLALVAGRI